MGHGVLATTRPNEGFHVPVILYRPSVVREMETLMNLLLHRAIQEQAPLVPLIPVTAAHRLEAR
jgi:hypothetical protein